MTEQPIFFCKVSSINSNRHNATWKGHAGIIGTPCFDWAQPLHLHLKLQSWTKVLGHFCVSGAFSNSHRSNPSPHPTNTVGRVFPEVFRVSTLYRVGGGRTARKFRKGCTVLRGNREMTEKSEYCSTVPSTFVQDCRTESNRWGTRAEHSGSYSLFASFETPTWITLQHKKKSGNNASVVAWPTTYVYQ